MTFDHSPYHLSPYAQSVLAEANARAERWRKRYVSALAEVEVLTKQTKPAKVKPAPLEDDNPMKETED